MKRLTKLLLGTILGTLMIGMTAFATEAEKPYQVTPTSAVGYTNEDTVVVADAMPTGAVVLTAEQCPDGIGIFITGITDTGYWEVDLGQVQKFYIAGPHLENIVLTGAAGNGAGAGVNSGATDSAVNNGAGTASAVTNATTNTTASAETAISGEEACIQWILNEYGTANVDECRWFYREYMKLYEQCKNNPKTYQYYRSEPYVYNPNDMQGQVSCYLSKVIDNVAFTSRYANGYSKLVVYKTESMADKGVYFD